MAKFLWDEREDVRDQEPARSVILTDIKIPFLSITFFMLKWTIASIPAILILGITSGLVMLIVADLIARGGV